MKSVNPSVYTKEYYLNTCLGFEEFNSYCGRKVHNRIKRLLSLVKIRPGMRILDIGCGRGDAAFYCARMGAEVIALDYSKAAISLAKHALRKQDKRVREKVKFLLLDVKKINFSRNYFDLIVAIDVFEHLYKEELEIIMSKISFTLKPKGMLIAHTEVNRILLDFIHPFYIYPVSSILIWLNKFLTKKTYPGLPKDPRNDMHKIQHVNEPTYFYLKSLFKEYGFKGKIIQNIGLLKPSISWKDNLYNVLALLYPISNFVPLIYFFATDYICIMKNEKKL